MEAWKHRRGDPPAGDVQVIIGSPRQRRGSRRSLPPAFLRPVRVRRSPGQKSLPPAARSTPFLCSCAKKRGGAPKKRASGCRHGSCSVPPASPTNSKPQHHSRLRQADLSARSTTNPLPKSGEDDPRPPRQERSRGWWSHRGKKGAFLWRLDTVSLGKHQRNGVERQDRLTTTSQSNGAHVQTQRKEGGTPGEGSPLDPLLRFNKHKGVPPAAAGGQGRCPCTPPPLKRWTKLSDKRARRGSFPRRALLLLKTQINRRRPRRSSSWRRGRTQGRSHPGAPAQRVCSGWTRRPAPSS